MSLLNPSLIPSELDELYSFANDRYFNNELPSHVDFDWSSRMTRKLGWAKPRTGLFDDKHLITLSDKLRQSPIKLLNVMVHEMLHIKQFHMTEVHNNKKYRDNPDNLPRFLRADYRNNKDFNSGHGHYFHAWKDELNSKFSELNIQTKDDEMFDDYELSDTQYLGVCVNYNHLGNNHHTIYYSESNLADLDKETLLADLVSLYGQDNIKGIKFFETTNPNVQSTVKLLKSGTISKRARQTYYPDDFVQSLLTDERTEVHSDFAVKADTSNDHIDLELRQVSGALRKANGMSFSGFVKTVALNYAHQTGKTKYKYADSDSLVFGADDVFSDDAIKYLYTKWSNAKELSFVESEAGKSIIKGLFSSLIKQDSPEFIESQLEKEPASLGLHRFDVAELMAHLAKKVVNHANRKSYGPNKEAILSRITNLKPKFQAMNEEQVLERSLRYLDKPFEKFVVKAIADAIPNGLLDFKAVHMDTLVDMYKNPEPSSVKHTATQTMFNYEIDRYFKEGSSFPEQEVFELLKSWDGRLDKDVVLKQLTMGYRSHMTEDKDVSLDKLMVRFNEVKERLLTPASNPSLDFSS